MTAPNPGAQQPQAGSSSTDSPLDIAARAFSSQLERENPPPDEDSSSSESSPPSDEGDDSLGPDAPPAEGSDATATPEPAPESGAGIRTFSDLAKAMGFEEPELAKHLQIEGPDGKRVPLADVLTQFRSGAPNWAQTQYEQQQIHAQRQAEMAMQQEAMGRLQFLSDQLLRQLDAEDRGIDWMKLKQEDPEQFLIKRMEVDERRRVAMAALQEHQQTSQRISQMQYAQQQQYREHEIARLLDAKPEWRDAQRAQKEITALRDFLVTQAGFTAEEFDNLADHRLVLRLWESYLYNQGKQGVTKKLEKLKSLPRVAPPGARVDRSRDRNAGRAAFERLRKTGDLRDAARAIEEMM